MQCIFPNAMGHPVTALVKTFLDQAIMAPAGIGLFFTCLGMMEGKSASKVGAVSQQQGCEHQTAKGRMQRAERQAGALAFAGQPVGELCWTLHNKTVQGCSRLTQLHSLCSRLGQVLCGKLGTGMVLNVNMTACCCPSLLPAGSCRDEGEVQAHAHGQLRAVARSQPGQLRLCASLTAYPVLQRDLCKYLPALARQSNQIWSAFMALECRACILLLDLYRQGQSSGCCLCNTRVMRVSLTRYSAAATATPCIVLQIFWVSFLSSMANKTQPKQGLHLDPALAQKEL